MREEKTGTIQEDGRGQAEEGPSEEENRMSSIALQCQDIKTTRIPSEGRLVPQCPGSLVTNSLATNALMLQQVYFEPLGEFKKGWGKGCDIFEMETKQKEFQMPESHQHTI